MRTGTTSPMTCAQDGCECVCVFKEKTKNRKLQAQLPLVGKPLENQPSHIRHRFVPRPHTYMALINIEQGAYIQWNIWRTHWDRGSYGGVLYSEVNWYFAPGRSETVSFIEISCPLFGLSLQEAPLALALHCSHIVTPCIYLLFYGFLSELCT